MAKETKQLKQNKFDIFIDGQYRNLDKKVKILALAAYNAGRGNVESWMEENHWDSTFSNIDKIPFAETREYVKKVLQFEKEYETIYTP